jgi:hypothetical protein
MVTENVLEIAKKIARKYGVKLEVEFIHNSSKAGVKISYENLKDLNGFLSELSKTPGVGCEIFYWNKSDSSKRDKYIV